MNMTLFEKRVFAYVLELRILRWNHLDCLEGPLFHDKRAHKRHTLETQRRGGDSVATESEGGVRSRRPRGAWSPQTLGEARRRSPPGPPEGGVPSTPGFWAWSPELGESEFLLSSVSQFVRVS